jgi:hypothetical protein
MELHFGMGWMRFDQSKSGLLAADWTRFLNDVLNPHVTSFRPTCFGLKDDRPNGSRKKVELNPVTLQWRRGRIRDCSLNVTVSRRARKPDPPRVSYQKRAHGNQPLEGEGERS